MRLELIQDAAAILDINRKKANVAILQAGDDVAIFPDGERIHVRLTVEYALGFIAGTFSKIIFL